MWLSVFKKEIRGFFSNLTGYLVIGIFLLANGLLLWVIPGHFNIIESGYAEMSGLFTLAPWLFLFLAPALTMKTIAEEKQTGTWELMLTRPANIWQIVTAKFAATWCLLILTLLPSIIYYISLRSIAEPVGNVDTGVIAGSFFGLIMLGGVYLSIGIWASSITRNQVLSFMLALAVCFLLYYGFAMLATFFPSGNISWWIENAGIQEHYRSVSRGVIDSRDIAYFIFLMMLFTFLTSKKLKTK